jgi:hypothetical protein
MLRMYIDEASEKDLQVGEASRFAASNLDKRARFSLPNKQSEEANRQGE